MTIPVGVIRPYRLYGGPNDGETVKVDRELSHILRYAGERGFAWSCAPLEELTSTESRSVYLPRQVANGVVEYWYRLPEATD